VQSPPQPRDYREKVTQHFINYVRAFNPTKRISAEERKEIIRQVIAAYGRARKEIDPRTKKPFSVRCIYRALGREFKRSKTTIQNYVKKAPK
jgi:ribosome maturation protein Sdo1